MPTAKQTGDTRVAVITGSSRGIGQATAMAMAQQGVRVVINGRDPQRVGDTVRLIQDAGGVAVGHVCDITDETAVAGLFSAVTAHWGRVDVLVNNAGAADRAPTLDMSMARWDQIFALNTRAALLCCRAAIPAMIQQGGGAIVNVSSTASKTAYLNAAVSYGASKAALNYITQHLAKEFATRNIRVNAVCPGYTRTEMVDSWPPGAYEAALREIPGNVMGRPADVASVIAYLASDGAQYINGELINVNGGAYMN